jgi:hypothetical protein
MQKRGKIPGKTSSGSCQFLPAKYISNLGQNVHFTLRKKKNTFTESEMTKNRVPNDFNKFSFDMTHSRLMKVKFLAAYYSYVSANDSNSTTHSNDVTRFCQKFVSFLTHMKFTSTERERTNSLQLKAI